MNNLNGKTAIITGASSGIGREIALALAGMQANIGIVYLHQDQKALALKNEIEQKGSKCFLVKADLRSEKCADEISKIIPEADILIHNVSIQYRNDWEQITLSEFQEQVNCNLRTALLISQRYAANMKKQNWGRIITIGSVQEAKPHPEMLVYSSVKNALTAMARSLAFQLAPFGITVNSVAPGVILTDRNTDVLKNEEYYQTVVSKIPAGRCGTTADCTGIVKLLCSDEGSYITGQNIFVDGGMSIH